MRQAEDRSFELHSALLVNAYPRGRVFPCLAQLLLFWVNLGIVFDRNILAVARETKESKTSNTSKTGYYLSLWMEFISKMCSPTLLLFDSPVYFVIIFAAICLVAACVLFRAMMFPKIHWWKVFLNPSSPAFFRPLQLQIQSVLLYHFEIPFLLSFRLFLESLTCQRLDSNLKMEYTKKNIKPSIFVSNNAVFAETKESSSRFISLLSSNLVCFESSHIAVLVTFSLTFIVCLCILLYSNMMNKRCADLDCVLLRKSKGDFFQALIRLPILFLKVYLFYYQMSFASMMKIYSTAATAVFLFSLASTAVRQVHYNSTINVVGLWLDILLVVFCCLVVEHQDGYLNTPSTLTAAFLWTGTLAFIIHRLITNLRVYFSQASVDRHNEIEILSLILHHLESDRLDLPFYKRYYTLLNIGSELQVSTLFWSQNIRKDDQMAELTLNDRNKATTPSKQLPPQPSLKHYNSISVSSVSSDKKPPTLQVFDGEAVFPRKSPTPMIKQTRAGTNLLMLMAVLNLGKRNTKPIEKEKLVEQDFLLQRRAEPRKTQIHQTASKQRTTREAQTGWRATFFEQIRLGKSVQDSIEADMEDSLLLVDDIIRMIISRYTYDRSKATDSTLLAYFCVYLKLCLLHTNKPALAYALLAESSNRVHGAKSKMNIKLIGKKTPLEVLKDAIRVHCFVRQRREAFGVANLDMLTATDEWHHDFLQGGISKLDILTLASNIVEVKKLLKKTLLVKREFLDDLVYQNAVFSSIMESSAKFTEHHKQTCALFDKIEQTVHHRYTPYWLLKSHYIINIEQNRLEGVKLLHRHMSDEFCSSMRLPNANDCFKDSDFACIGISLEKVSHHMINLLTPGIYRHLGYTPESLAGQRLEQILPMPIADYHSFITSPCNMLGSMIGEQKGTIIPVLRADGILTKTKMRLLLSPQVDSGLSAVALIDFARFEYNEGLMVIDKHQVIQEVDDLAGSIFTKGNPVSKYSPELDKQLKDAQIVCHLLVDKGYPSEFDLIKDPFLLARYRTFLMLRAEHVLNIQNSEVVEFWTVRGQLRVQFIPQIKSFFFYLSLKVISRQLHNSSEDSIEACLDPNKISEIAPQELGLLQLMRFISKQQDHQPVKQLSQQLLSPPKQTNTRQGSLVPLDRSGVLQLSTVQSSVSLGSSTNHHDHRLEPSTKKSKSVFKSSKKKKNHIQTRLKNNILNSNHTFVLFFLLAVVYLASSWVGLGPWVSHTRLLSILGRNLTIGDEISWVIWSLGYFVNKEELLRLNRRGLIPSSYLDKIAGGLSLEEFARESNKDFLSKTLKSVITVELGMAERVSDRFEGSEQFKRLQKVSVYTLANKQAANPAASSNYLLQEWSVLEASKYYQPLIDEYISCSDYSRFVNQHGTNLREAYIELFRKGFLGSMLKLSLDRQKAISAYFRSIARESFNLSETICFVSFVGLGISILLVVAATLWWRHLMVRFYSKLFFLEVSSQVSRSKTFAIRSLPTNNSSETGRSS